VNIIPHINKVKILIVDTDEIDKSNNGIINGVTVYITKQRTTVLIIANLFKLPPYWMSYQRPVKGLIMFAKMCSEAKPSKLLAVPL
jgi:hypothetical protein